MAVSDKRDINEQLASSHGSFELVMSPVLMGLGGWWLDGKLGTGPWILIGAAVFGFTGALVKVYYDYKLRMASVVERAGTERAERSAEQAAKRKVESDARAAANAALARELADAEAQSVLTNGSTLTNTSLTRQSA